MKIKNILGAAAVTATLASCSTNPITGRSSLHLANDQQISAMALQQYNQTLSESKVITGTTDAKRITNVGQRIKNAAENYYRSIGRASDLANYNWQFALIQDAQMNAWCMPGGKVAFYSGIMPICKDDTGVAVVMGHEVSHALAGHGNERISQAMLAQYGGAIAGSAISSAQWSSIFSQVYPVGAQVALLKYGRNQELEADRMGLYLMGMAGYDPRQAQPFWERMEQASQGRGRTPEFLSSHPSPDNRRADLNKWMPEALQYYKQSGGKI